MRDESIGGGSKNGNDTGSELWQVSAKRPRGNGCHCVQLYENGGPRRFGARFRVVSLSEGTRVSGLPFPPHS